MSIKISTSLGFHRWKPASWLRITGADALSFLQGQCTQELRRLAPGEGTYALWLTVKGKVLADSFVLRGQANDWWIASYGSPAAVLRERLEAFIIADDVTIEDLTSSWTAVSWLGGEPGPAPAGVVVFTGRRQPGGNVEWAFPASAAPAVEPLLTGHAERTTEELERIRILAGLPAVPRDLGPADLPPEGGLESVAISYTKGCYLGQEVMARLHAMGQVRRGLRGVRGPGPAPATPAPVHAGGRVVGEVRSAIAEGGGFVGLAMVSLAALAEGTLTLGSPEGPRLEILAR